MKKLVIDPTLAADQEIRFQTSEGTPVTVRLIYNVRSGFWNMDVTAGGATLYGVKLVPGWPLLKEYKATFSIVGDFLFLPTSTDARDSVFKYEDLGVVWFAYWLTEAEAAAWEVSRGLG